MSFEISLYVFQTVKISLFITLKDLFGKDKKFKQNHIP